MRTILGKKYYIISDSGRAATGYFIYKNRLYYADSTGRCYQNRSRENGQLKFTSSGAAVNDVNAQVKMWAMRTVASVTKPNMKQRQKLYACWKYLVNANNYSYGGPDPNQKKADWQRTTVLRMIRTNVGNCFGFSCTFSALARELGYKPYLIMGRVPGTRDGVADGLTSHCWVRINGLYYDPEADWAGWMQGVFAYSYYPTSRCQILKITPYYQ